MVAGKVKAVMGLQKSPATPKLETSRRSSSSPNNFNGKTSVFSRSFGVYFPRSSSQVQPRPPDVADLIRLIEELQEKESRLRTEILEQKILKETVALVPFLEKEVSARSEELDQVKNVVKDLEAENRALRMEVEVLMAKVREAEEEGRKKEVEIEELKRTIMDHQGEIDDCSSSMRFQGLIDVSAKSVLLKNIRKSPKLLSNLDVSKRDAKSWKGEEKEIDQMMNQQKEETVKPRPARIPKPPPLPSTSLYKSSKTAGTRNAVPMPPPPPPPPPPTKGGKSGEASVRRVPEVVEFYHSMMRRDAKRDSGGGGGDFPAAANARNMIGEIENRSAHLLAVSFFPSLLGCSEFTKLPLSQSHCRDREL